MNNSRKVEQDKMLAALMGNLNAIHFVLCNAETHLYMHTTRDASGAHIDEGDRDAMRLIQDAIRKIEAAQWA